MKNYWAQPSLSRDFSLLSAAIFFVLLLMSFWITYTTYTRHTELVADELSKESMRIERALASEMESANYMLNAMGKQIVIDNGRDLVKLAQVLKSYDSKGYLYSILSWIGPDGHLLVSSNHGVLDKPVDTSDRDYVQRATAEPWKMHIGRPIEGRVSERWVIPVAMGITDYTGKFIGTIMISIDISTLTERLSNLVKRDGISFAIVSKTLIPLTQVSDDKDFVTNNFPTQKLANANFTTNPTGLIAKGSMFFGTDNYSYYSVSTEYPYIILLGYDSRYSDETLRSLLWGRLMQMAAIALFLLAFMWIVRARMIKPVLNMTAAAASVAKGEPYMPPPAGGPIEIAGLAAQVRLIGDYIEEIKRVEEELRNKMFMLKKAKEHAEIDRRSKSEFLAYVCQEVRIPLNNIINFSQVMRDQLYGPIENRKYRQHAADIYQTGNALMTNLQDLLTLSKIETGYIDLLEKPVDVPTIMHKVIRFVSDKMQAEKLNINVKLQEPMPKLIADEFRFQQILSNLLLYALAYTLPKNTLSFEARVISENKDKAFLVILIAPQELPAMTQGELITRVEKMSQATPYVPSQDREITQETSVNLSLELAKSLISAHQGYLDIVHLPDGSVKIAIFFGSGRVRFIDAHDEA